MALSDNLIEKHRIAACDSGPLHFSAAMRFARAIEAEARKGDEALIRQMLDAAIAIYPHLNGLAVRSDEALALLQQQISAITAARARLAPPPSANSRRICNETTETVD